MSGDSKKNNLNEILNKLNSGREEVIIDTINLLRDKGDIDILPELFKLLASEPAEILEIQISSFLNDLKTNNAQEVIIQSIQENRKGSHLDKMISSCWQNGLDFSQHLSFFVDIAIEEDYMTAIESFSVVEENISSLELPEREALSAYLKKRMKSSDKSKVKLLEEMHKLISSFSGPLKLDLLN